MVLWSYGRINCYNLKKQGNWGEGNWSREIGEFCCTYSEFEVLADVLLKRFDSQLEI